MLTIILRRDESFVWRYINPILRKGELAIECDTHQIKIGDGITNWNSLEYCKEFPILFKIFDKDTHCRKIKITSKGE